MNSAGLATLVSYPGKAFKFRSLILNALGCRMTSFYQGQGTNFQGGTSELQKKSKIKKCRLPLTSLEHSFECAEF